MSIETISLSNEQSILKNNSASYSLFIRNGIVASDPIIKDGYSEFFFKNETLGKEYSARLKSAINTRTSHQISILYSQKQDTDHAYPVAWVNHTTDEIDYLENSTRELVGNKASLIFIQMGHSITESLNRLSAPHGAFINLIMIPVYLLLLAFVLACLCIGGVLGLRSEGVVKKILKRSEAILSDNNINGFKPYKKKKSKIVTFFKWVFILWILFGLFSIVGGLVFAILGAR